MENVNWVQNAEYHETQSVILNCVFKELFNTGFKEIYIHDPEVSNDQPDEFLRILDDSPGDWDEFLRYHTRTEFHLGYVKNQADGRKLFKLIEGYPGATQLPPIYILVKED